jgi:hypothetical protein
VKHNQLIAQLDDQPVYTPVRLEQNALFNRPRQFVMCGHRKHSISKAMIDEIRSKLGRGGMTSLGSGKAATLPFGTIQGASALQGGQFNADVAKGPTLAAPFRSRFKTGGFLGPS